MAATTDIPRHPLRNAAGHPVPFDLHVWGASQGHDFLEAHRHSFHEILVFETGGATHDIDFRSYQPGARSVHFVASDNVHLLVRNEYSEGYSLLFTSDFFPEELIDRLPFSKAHPAMQITAPDFKQMTALTQHIRRELAGDEHLSCLIVKSLAEALLLLLARSYHSQHPQGAQSSLPDILQQFRQLVREYYTQHLGVAAYADRLAVSPKHLIALCKKHTGKTPLKHIQEQTIGEAKRLLFHTQLSVKEIAYRLAFDEPAAFSKYFKACTGYTPAAYRGDAR